MCPSFNRWRAGPSLPPGRAYVSQAGASPHGHAGEGQLTVPGPEAPEAPQRLCKVASCVLTNPCTRRSPKQISARITPALLGTPHWPLRGFAHTAPSCGSLPFLGHLGPGPFRGPPLQGWLLSAEPHGPVLRWTLSLSRAVPGSPVFYPVGAHGPLRTLCSPRPSTSLVFPWTQSSRRMETCPHCPPMSISISFVFREPGAEYPLAPESKQARIDTLFVLKARPLQMPPIHRLSILETLEPAHLPIITLFHLYIGILV